MALSRDPKPEQSPQGTGCKFSDKREEGVSTLHHRVTSRVVCSQLPQKFRRRTRSRARGFMHIDQVSKQVGLSFARAKEPDCVVDGASRLKLNSWKVSQHAGTHARVPACLRTALRLVCFDSIPGSARPLP